jgi:hypothetical protein
MGRKHQDRGELSEREKEAFLKRMSKGSADDARETRGMLALFLVVAVFGGADAFVIWKAGFDMNRGVAMILVAQLVFAGWIYRVVSQKRR